MLAGLSDHTNSPNSSVLQANRLMSEDSTHFLLLKTVPAPVSNQNSASNPAPSTYANKMPATADEKKTPRQMPISELHTIHEISDDENDLMCSDSQMILLNSIKDNQEEIDKPSEHASVSSQRGNILLPNSVSISSESESDDEHDSANCGKPQTPSFETNKDALISINSSPRSGSNKSSAITSAAPTAAVLTSPVDAAAEVNSSQSPSDSAYIHQDLRQSYQPLNKIIAGSDDIAADIQEVSTDVEAQSVLQLKAPSVHQSEVMHAQNVVPALDQVTGLLCTDDEESDEEVTSIKVSDKEAVAPPHAPNPVLTGMLSFCHQELSYCKVWL